MSKVNGSVSAGAGEVTAAIKTLQSKGYTYHGGEQWKPPAGNKPDFDLIDTLRAQLEEKADITLYQVMRAYEYACTHPHGYQRGTTNWCAAVAHSLNVQVRSTLERKP